MLTCEEAFNALNKNDENWETDYLMFEVFSYYNSLINIQEETVFVSRKYSNLIIEEKYIKSINELAYELGEAIALNKVDNCLIDKVKNLLNKLFPN